MPVVWTEKFDAKNKCIIGAADVFKAKDLRFITWTILSFLSFCDKTSSNEMNFKDRIELR
jgi:hypothetical protein